MLRHIAASIALALVALSVAAIVAAQDQGGESATANRGAAQMRVRKLPPVTEVGPHADVIKLDHFGQGTVSQATLLGVEEAYAAPAALADTQAQPIAHSSSAITPISPTNIEAAKQQAAAQTQTLSSAMQRDLGVVLAADWSAVHKASRGNKARRDLPANVGEIERQRANGGEPQAPAGSALQPTPASLEDKISGLRDSIIGSGPQPIRGQQVPRPMNQRRTVFQSAPAPTRAPLTSGAPSYAAPAMRPQREQMPTLADEPTPVAEAMEADTRSNAPEAPSVPRLSSRSTRQNTPSLANGPAQRVTSAAPAAREPSTLESSRQRRDPGSWDDTEAETVPTATRSSSRTASAGNQLRGSATVASEPVTPAIPQDVNDEPATAAKSETISEPEVATMVPESIEAEPALTSIASKSTTAAKPESDRVLMSVAGPQLKAQAVGPRRIVISRNAEFEVTVMNEGDVEANDVVVSVQLPNWVDVTSTQPSRGSAKAPTATEVDQPLLWRIARLEANSSEVLKINLVPRRSQPLDMSVRWTYAQTATNTLVEVEEPMLQMVISGPGEAVFGQTKLYNLTLSNPGTGDAQNVVLSLLPLEGKQEAAASTKIGTLAHGETKTIQVELSAGKAGVLLVKANASADGGLKAEASKEVLVRRAHLMIEVVAPEAEYAGNAAGYLVRVTNDGNAAAEDVTVNVVLPPGAEYVTSSSEGRFEQKQGRVRWDIASLAAGQIREYRLAAKLHSPGENRLHTTVQDKSDLSAVADVQTAVIARADLKLLVTDPHGPVPVGEEAVYEMTIHNRGTQTAEAVEAVIFFSEGIEPVRVEGADHEIGSGQVIFKTIPQINANGELVLKVTARADRPGNHVFRAEILCRSIGTKLAAEETTHFYGKELTAEASQPTARTASLPTPVAAPAKSGSSPSLLPPAAIETK